MKPARTSYRAERPGRRTVRPNIVRLIPGETPLPIGPRPAKVTR
jgi:hypothetical protein